ncbi:Gfo/Idh/MocA family protein [Ileibacterium valens]|uniref:Gfo/Idh/MocA family protein n=1 Tax=Ileibacterium valens TaxID=1862668 RepID=UPI00259B0DED|nr:Gfo/Idh/MocA family oxidoreductase [Ileibacterium valens]
MKQYRWALSGSGWISTEMARTLHDNHHTITGIYSKDRKTAKEAAEKYGIEHVFDSYEEMLADSDTDIIYIGTPNEIHEEEAIKALKAGKHVFCEKPMGLNEEQFVRCLDLAEKKDLILMDGTTLLHMPLFKDIRKVLETGKLGKLKMIQVTYGIQKDFNPDSRFYSLEHGGGALMDIGLYAISFLCLYMDNVPDHVKTYVSKASTGVDETSAIIVQNKDGQIGNISLSLNTMMLEQAILCLEKGYILVHGFPRADQAVVHYVDGKTDIIESGNSEQALEYEMKEMESAIEENRQPKGLKDAREVMHILTQIRKQWNIEFPSEQEQGIDCIQ